MDCHPVCRFGRLRIGIHSKRSTTGRDCLLYLCAIRYEYTLDKRCGHNLFKRDLGNRFCCAMCAGPSPKDSLARAHPHPCDSTAAAMRNSCSPRRKTEYVYGIRDRRLRRHMLVNAEG